MRARAGAMKLFVLLDAAARRMRDAAVDWNMVKEERKLQCRAAMPYIGTVRVLCGEKRRGWWEEPKAGTRKCREGNQEKRNHAVSPDASSTQAHKANGDVRSSQLISMDSRCQQQRPLFPVYAALHQNLY